MPALEFPIRFDRAFQVWSYSVSHSVLLLRSNQSIAHPTRIDLMFRAVGELRLRSRLEGLTVDLASMSQLSNELNEIQVSRGDSIFTLSSDDFARGYVVASAMYLSEDALSYGEPSTIDNPDLTHAVIRSGYFSP